MRVPEGEQVPDRLLDRPPRRRTTTRGNGSSSIDGVDEHGRQVALGEALVVVVVGVALGVEPAGEDDPRDLLLEQQLDVVGLGDAAGGLGAQHRREALLRERSADHLGEGREDRVLQLGQHQPDEPGPLAAQLGRSLVAEHVERREHRAVASETPGLPLSTRLTVASLTPTWRPPRRVDASYRQR